MDIVSIRKHAMSVLRELGHYEEYECSYAIRPSYHYWKYEGNGLRISSKTLPPFINPKEGFNYVKDVSIYFDNKYVFDSSNNFYEPGEWEQDLINYSNELKKKLKKNYVDKRLVYLGILK